jgi:hypothetical protein
MYREKNTKIGHGLKEKKKGKFRARVPYGTVFLAPDKRGKTAKCYPEGK